MLRPGMRFVAVSGRWHLVLGLCMTLGLAWPGCILELERDFDQDGDSFEIWDDCNDSDRDIHPLAIDTCEDGIDQNCNGVDSLCSSGISASPAPDPSPPDSGDSDNTGDEDEDEDEDEDDWAPGKSEGKGNSPF